MIEQSDVVIQVVDARDPLFYHNNDLNDYVKEISVHKETVVLMNKADYLTKRQRQQWAEYFAGSDMRCLFFSAVESDGSTNGDAAGVEHAFNVPDIQTPADVLQTLQAAITRVPLTAGFLGYPNVGKSSTINCFLSNKRLQVSATPGKTKHYQTHVLQDGEIKLMDGPGLVMPNLSMTKADMVLGGILPIDNLTDFLPSVDLLLSKIPYIAVLNHYGILPSSLSRAKRVDRNSTSMQVMRLSS